MLARGYRIANRPLSSTSAIECIRSHAYRWLSVPPAEALQCQLQWEAFVVLSQHLLSFAIDSPALERSRGHIFGLKRASAIIGKWIGMDSHAIDSNRLL